MAQQTEKEERTSNMPGALHIHTIILAPLTE
jgi:hypothetical protein